VQENYSKSEREKQAAQLMEKIKEKLRPYVMNTSDYVDSALLDIVQNVFDLDAAMQTQKAHYYVETWQLGHIAESIGQWVSSFPRFDYIKMEDMSVEGRVPESGAVTIVVVPALLKAGNMAGEFYDTLSVIVKAKVIVSQTLSILDRSTRMSMEEQRTSKQSSQMVRSTQSQMTFFPHIKR